MVLLHYLPHVIRNEFIVVGKIALVCWEGVCGAGGGGGLGLPPEILVR